jgi:hypothetical protein
VAGAFYLCCCRLHCIVFVGGRTKRSKFKRDFLSKSAQPLRTTRRTRISHSQSRPPLFIHSIQNCPNPPEKMGKTNKPRGQSLIMNLPQLQNLIKRDPQSYKDEFAQQWRHYESSLAIFRLKPDDNSKEFGELITFISHVGGNWNHLV